MNIITITNISEQKESTLTALNLSYILSQKEYRILLIDWSINQYLTEFIIDDYNHNHITKEFYDSDFDINTAIIKTKHRGIHILPSGLEVLASATDYNYHMLYTKLKQVAYDYDYCILDCSFPSNINALKMAFLASDKVLIPVVNDQRIPEYLDIVKRMINDIYLHCEHQIDYKLFIYETFGKLPYKKVLQFLKNIEDDRILNTFLPDYIYENTFYKNILCLDDFLVFSKIEGSYKKLAEEFLGKI